MSKSLTAVAVLAIVYWSAAWALDMSSTPLHALGGLQSADGIKSSMMTDAELAAVEGATLSVSAESRALVVRLIGHRVLITCAGCSAEMTQYWLDYSRGGVVAQIDALCRVTGCAITFTGGAQRIVGGGHDNVTRQINTGCGLAGCVNVMHRTQINIGSGVQHNVILQSNH